MIIKHSHQTLTSGTGEKTIHFVAINGPTIGIFIATYFFPLDYRKPSGFGAEEDSE
jgi:hypothetical protein